ncbi:MAG: hypothetical protein K2Q22_04490, partial [Cytophagales bacterium]|nr:hypothetical protein [Cytophagales bacterium]
MSTATTFDQTTVNGTLLLNSGTNILTIADGTGTDLTINSGGVLEVAGTNITTTVFTGTVFVAGGGIVRYTSGGGTGVSTYLGGTSTNSNLVYGHGAVFDWNSILTFNSNGITYFSTSSSTDIPIFRTSKSVSSIGGTLNTVINGIFEANAAISFANAGTKTFRNGIIGTGNVTQNSNSGQLIISGTTATLGGTGAISLNTNGMAVNLGSSLVLTSDKTINGSAASNTCTVMGSIDCSTYKVSGTSTFAMANGA